MQQEINRKLAGRCDQFGQPQAGGVEKQYDERIGACDETAVLFAVTTMPPGVFSGTTLKGARFAATPRPRHVAADTPAQQPRNRARADEISQFTDGAALRRPPRCGRSSICGYPVHTRRGSKSASPTPSHARNCLDVVAVVVGERYRGGVRPEVSDEIMSICGKDKEKLTFVQKGTYT